MFVGFIWLRAFYTLLNLGCIQSMNWSWENYVSEKGVFRNVKLCIFLRVCHNEIYFAAVLVILKTFEHCLNKSFEWSLLRCLLNRKLCTKTSPFLCQWIFQYMCWADALMCTQCIDKGGTTLPKIVVAVPKNGCFWYYFTKNSLYEYGLI